MRDFSGTKVALISKNKILAIQRDNKPDIDFPGAWDLPGGAREASETPIEVAQREIKEELGIEIDAQKALWQKIYPAVSDPNKIAYFMVFELDDKQLEQIIFGPEGLRWKMMPFKDFINHTNAVVGMQQRLKDYLVSTNNLR